MTQKELIDRTRELMLSDLDLMKRKNNDYAGEDDALKNLGLFGFFGVCVRLSDKLMRLVNFAKGKGLLVKCESILDTLQDIRIYAILAEVMFNMEHGLWPLVDPSLPHEGSEDSDL